MNKCIYFDFHEKSDLKCSLRFHLKMQYDSFIFNQILTAPLTFMNLYCNSISILPSELISPFHVEGNAKLRSTPFIYIYTNTTH